MMFVSFMILYLLYKTNIRKQFKYNTMTIADLKEQVLKKVALLDSKVDQRQRMQVAINLKIALATVNRYLAGEVRKIELAEDIINECNKVLKSLKVA